MGGGGKITHLPSLPTACSPPSLFLHPLVAASTVEKLPLVQTQLWGNRSGRSVNTDKGKQVNESENNSNRKLNKQSCQNSNPHETELKWEKTAFFPPLLVFLSSSSELRAKTMSFKTRAWLITCCSIHSGGPHVCADSLSAIQLTDFHIYQLACAGQDGYCWCSNKLRQYKHTRSKEAKGGRMQISMRRHGETSSCLSLCLFLIPLLAEKQIQPINL